MAKRPEVIDLAEAVNLATVNKESLAKLPRVALVHLISSGNPATYPGGSIDWLEKTKLIKLVLQNKDVQQHIAAAYRVSPGLFNRLHLSLWRDAFPDDDRDHCLKMRFAAAFIDSHYKVVMLRSQNRRMTIAVPPGGDRLCSGESCVRDQIASRTDGVMGDCGHAYLWGMQQLLRAGWSTDDISGLDKYEAGFNLKNKDNSDIWYEPWIGKEPAYTCLYCITVLRWLLDQSTVTVFKDLDGRGPEWVTLDLKSAFYDEARQVAQKQGLEIPLVLLDKPRN